MKSLLIFPCLLAIAAAKPGVLAPASHGSPLITPSAYSYSTYYPSGTPLAYSPHVPIPSTHSTSPQVTSPITAIIHKTQYHSQDELGQASYGHSEALQTHNAVQDAAGNKMGSYSYIAPDGRVISTNYIADSLGYRVTSNAVPVGPSNLPVAPSETPEVLAARAAHFKAHEIVKSRFRRSVAVATPITYSPFGVRPVGVGYSTPVVRLAPIGTHAVPFIV